MSKFDYKNRIYADNAATTAVSQSVMDAMLPFFKEYWGNPSSIHYDGQKAKEFVDDARARIAAALGCEAREIFFTSCGTESDNWAIKGAAYAPNNRKKRIVTTKIEHHAVLHTCESLAKDGFDVVYVGVDENGVVNMDELKEAVNDSTFLVSVMYANNEIGTIQPIKEICEIAHSHGALMFTDAVQAVGNLPIDLKELGVDMMSMSGHKLHAPKGIGALYVKKGVRLKNLVDGGGQENGKRGGTENVPYIMGMAQAITDATARLSKIPQLEKMRNKLIDGLLEIPYTKLNGHPKDRLPGNVNVSFEYVEGEGLALWLDHMGISVSTASACSSKSLEPSHVLLATGLAVEKAHGTVRFSLSLDNTDEEIDYIIATVQETVQKLRAMSPIFPG